MRHNNPDILYDFPAGGTQACLGQFDSDLWDFPLLGDHGDNQIDGIQIRDSYQGVRFIQLGLF